MKTMGCILLEGSCFAGDSTVCRSRIRVRSERNNPGERHEHCAMDFRTHGIEPP
jgi:hypothetical protein